MSTKKENKKSKASAKSRKMSAERITQIDMKDIWVEQNIRDAGWEKKIADLKASIAAQGLLQPIGVVEKEGPGKKRYKLIFGGRRYEACKELNYKKIDARIAPKRLTATDLFLWKLGENNSRKDLSPLEESRALHRAINEFKISAKELARRLGKTSGYVSQRLALLKLPEKVQDAVEEGRITATHAREISRVTDKKEQEKLVGKAEKMPVNDFKDYVANMDEKKRKHSNRGRKPQTKEIGEPAGIRSEKESVKMLGVLDERMKTAAQQDSPKARLEQEYYKGCIRGIMWARKMGGARKLF